MYKSDPTEQYVLIWKYSQNQLQIKLQGNEEISHFLQYILHWQAISHVFILM